VGIDAFVTLLVTAVVYTQARNDTGSRFGWTALGYALLAAIVLAKGAPIAIALLALAGYAVLARGPRGLVPRHLLWGAPLLLALLALWAVPAATSLRGGPGYLEGLTLGQAGKRIVGEDISHEQPLWYYVATFPGQFLPFTLLLPAAAVTAVRDLRAGGRPRRETGRYVLWFALPFLLFTLIPGKRERYLLPIYPAAAALVGIAVVRLAGTARFRALVRAPVAAALAVLGLAGLAVAALPLTFDGLVGPRLAMLDSLTLAEVSGAIRAWVSVLMVGGISTAIVASEGLLRRRDAAPLAPLVATVAVLVFTLGAGLLPALDRVKSYGRLAKPVARMAGPDARFALVGLQPGPFLLALDRHDLDRFDGSGRGRRALERMLTEPNTVVFATTDDFESMRRKAEFPLSVLSTRRVGRREIVAFRRE